MNKPHWQLQHEWWIEDFKFDLDQIWQFKLMLRKHPDDAMTDIFKELIKNTEKHLKCLRKDYEKIYGHKPNIYLMRKIIEI